MNTVALSKPSSRSKKHANMQRRGASDSGLTDYQKAVDSLSPVATLGKDDNTSAKHAKSEKFRAFRLLSFAQSVLYEHDIKATRSGKPHKTRFCHAVRKYGAPAINLNVAPEGAPIAATLSGVQTCGCVWSCAVCAKRLAMARGKEIKRALAYGRENGLMPVMLTLTASHQLNTPLKPHKEAFKRAFKKLSKNGSYRRLLRRLGIVGTIKAVEITRTYENGWHYHYHILMLIDKALMMALGDWFTSDFRGKLTALWLAALASEGLYGNEAHALNLSYHGNIAEKYLSKLGLESDEKSNLEYELTAGANKNYKGRNIWEILRSASNGNEADKSLYVEYVESMSGDNWIVWSDGLKKLVGIGEKSDEEAADEEAAAEALHMEKLLSISDEDFRPVRYYRAQADLLELAASTRSVETVIDFLDRLRADYEQSAIVERRARLQAQYAALDDKFNRWRKHFIKQNEFPPEGHEMNLVYRKMQQVKAQLAGLES